MDVVFYTNCQYSGIQYFLDIYYSRLGIDVKFHHIENYSLIRENRDLDYALIEKADVFIYQPISCRHGVYSTHSDVQGGVISFLKPDCIAVSFPYIYNSALWAIVPPAEIDNLIGGYGEASRYLNREVIEAYAERGDTLKSILRAYRRGRVNFKYQERFDESIRILREKEAGCDVKVADFIAENIRRRRLFFTQNHPATAVFVHCANQIIDKLGGDSQFEASDYPENVGSFSKGWPVGSSDQKFWRFRYKIKYRSDSFYRKHIERIYRQYLLSHVHPLSYSIPEERITSKLVEKTRVFGQLIPGKADTYIYNDQGKYYEMYQEAMFGVTYCKGGWDCLRHYEIIANKCLPYFLGLENCPDLSMQTMPKKLILEAMQEIDDGSMTADKYRNYIERIQKHARNHMTCRSSAEYVVKIMTDRRSAEQPRLGRDAPRVLMINVGSMNYSRDLLTIGLRKLLGERFTDYPCNSYVYTGDAFTFTGLINDQGVDRSNLGERLKALEFDFVIWGSLDFPLKTKLRKLPLWKLVHKHYRRDRIAFIFGGDRSPFLGPDMGYPSEALQECLEYGVCFVREFGESDEAINGAGSWFEYSSLRRKGVESKIIDVEQTISNTGKIQPFEV